MAVGLLGFTLVLVASAAPLAAQKADIKARGYFGLGGGLSIPVGDYADVTKTGWVGDVFGGFTTKGGLVGGRLDAMWAQNSNKRHLVTANQLTAISYGLSAFRLLAASCLADS